MNALALLEPVAALRVPEAAPCHRLFHGRGGTWPGLDWLVIDRYAPVLLVTVFACEGEYPREALLATLVPQLAGLGCQCLVLQSRSAGGFVTAVVSGTLPEAPVAEELGLRFILDFERGQNVGFFADMVPARQWLAQRAEGKKVLNLFSFTCAFSVVALAHGAESVVNIDLSKPALAQGQRNHQLNGVAGEGAHFLPHDIFKSWKKLHSLGRYDIIILDPPSEQKGSFMARRDYARVVRKLSKLLKPDADLLACLNAPWLDEAFLAQVVEDNLPGVERVARLPFAPGFPEANPDAGLKVIHYHYRRPDSLPAMDDSSDD